MNRIILGLMLFSALFLTPFVTAAPAPETLAQARSLGNAFSQIAESAGAGVVSIRVEKKTPVAYRGRSMGQGSGFLVSADGYLLTNHHVVASAGRIVVVLRDGREFVAKVIGSDPKSDVALLKVEGKDLPYLKLGDSDAMRVGEWVVAIGNPFGLSSTVTAGIVSAKGRNSVGINDYENFIQTDAAINPGNSGGPLLNLRGEVIGINSAILSRSGANAGIGFAIPVNLAKRVQEQLRRNGKVVRGYLGVTIQELTPELAETFGTRRGVLVADVAKGSPAERAGLQAGDVVVALGGDELKNIGALRNRVAALAPGAKAMFAVMRDGSRLEVEVTIGTRAERPSTMKLGFAVEARRDGPGVRIKIVKPGSVAEAAGLRPGYVILKINREPVSSAEDFARLLQAAKGRILLLVHDGRGVRWMVLK